MTIKVVGFQGEPGAYSEEAIVQHYHREAEPKPCRTVSDVFNGVASGKMDAGMIPVENSIGGNVYESYDLLISSNLHVIAEVYLKVHHCLISNRGSSKGELKKVYSHPQALEQCRKFVSGLGAEMLSSYDTAGSVMAIKKSGAVDSAAIASRRAADIYGLAVLAENIEDNPNNTTRFLVISREQIVSAGKLKTSIVFQVPNTPGSLYNAMGLFAKRGINLTKIESRPSKERQWEYFFLLDFEGSTRESGAAEALDELRRIATFVKVIGSYPEGIHS